MTPIQKITPSMMLLLVLILFHSNCGCERGPSKLLNNTQAHIAQRFTPSTASFHSMPLDSAELDNKPNRSSATDPLETAIQPVGDRNSSSPSFFSSSSVGSSGSADSSGSTPSAEIPNVEKSVNTSAVVKDLEQEIDKALVLIIPAPGELKEELDGFIQLCDLEEKCQPALNWGSLISFFGSAAYKKLYGDCSALLNNLHEAQSSALDCSTIQNKITTLITSKKGSLSALIRASCCKNIKLSLEALKHERYHRPTNAIHHGIAYAAGSLSSGTISCLPSFIGDNKWAKWVKDYSEHQVQIIDQYNQKIDHAIACYAADIKQDLILTWFLKEACETKINVNEARSAISNISSIEQNRYSKLQPKENYDPINEINATVQCFNAVFNGSSPEWVNTLGHIDDIDKITQVAERVKS